MRSFVFAVILVALAPTAASADANEPRDAGWDTGAKVALGGGIAFSFLYSTTAISTAVGDSLCGLGESPSSCNNQHSNLYIPLVGGFLPGRNDWSQGIGIASSVLQLTAAGILVGGLVAHHWHVKESYRLALERPERAQ